MMVEKLGERYLQYRRKTPFLMPLPRKVASLITAPVRIMFDKGLPESGKKRSF